MIKVLWVSARKFDEEKESRSGVWLKALAEQMCELTSIELGNITCSNSVVDIMSYDFNGIRQWVFPYEKLDKNGLPSEKIRKHFQSIVADFNPDILQIWGSENPLGLLPFEIETAGIKVLTMQGVLSSISSVVYSGLSFREILRTIGLRELYFRKGVFFDKYSFNKSGMVERRMIQKCKVIVTQSEWTESQIKLFNPSAKFFRTNRALRKEFLDAEKWRSFQHSEPILYSAAVGYSIKGLHVLIRALAELKVSFPNIRLRLAGASGRKDIFGIGYFRFIDQLIKKFDLEDNVIWLGAISADTIVRELQSASVFVNPSFIESYSLTLTEAMYIGTPSVVSFAGAMPELADNNKEALFFTPGDYKRCAYLIGKLLVDQKLSNYISLNAIQKAQSRNTQGEIVSRQLEIYKEILSIYKPGGSSLSAE